MEPNKPGDAQVIIDTVKALHAPSLVELPDHNFIGFMPRGMEAVNLKPLMDQYLTAPERRKGQAVFTDLDSFIAHANRFKDADSAVFADDDEDKPSFTSVMDYHRAGHESSARFGQHRGHYAPALSEPWEAWAKAEDAGPMRVGEFSALLQDRLADIIDPPQHGGNEADAKLLDIVGMFGGAGFAGQSRLLELAKGLRVRDTQEATSFNNIQTGEVEIAFKSTHTTQDGAPLVVPSAFLVGIPVFHRGAPYRMVIRLLYRMANGSVTWTVKRYRPDIIFEHAFMEACARITAETALPLMRGKPE
jgi:hypothetical protein